LAFQKFCTLFLPQIIPFLALGLGVDDMFLIAHTFAENGAKSEIPHMVRINYGYSSSNRSWDMYDAQKHNQLD